MITGAAGRPMPGIIADDFTGAMDTGAQFAQAGRVYFLLGQGPGVLPDGTLILSTNSREIDREQALDAARHAATRLRGRPLFKKIDSTMRGHVSGEILAVLEASGLAKALVCPAVIEAGRRVSDGLLYVYDQPLHLTAFAHDPIWPAQTSVISELLRIPAAAHIPRTVVEAGPHAVEAAALAAPAPIASVDAQTEADLLCIAEAALRGSFLPCGAFGLAKAWLATAGYAADSAPDLPRPQGAVLALVGSQHPATREQAARLAAAHSLVELTVADLGDQLWPTLRRALMTGRGAVLYLASERMPAAVLASDKSAFAALAWRAAHEAPPGAWVMTGGETACLICGALGVEAVEIGGQIEPGLPWGIMRGGAAAGAILITKAGGFGTADTLSNMLKALHAAKPAPSSK